MLSARYLSKLPDDLVYLFSELEKDISVSMAKRLAKNDYDVDSVAWQSKKLEQMGYLKSEIDAMIAKHIKPINKGVYDALLKSAAESIRDDNIDASKAYEAGTLLTYPLDLKDNEKLLNIVEAGIKQTQYELVNFTRTLAIVTNQEFIRLLDVGWLEKRTGLKTHEQIVNDIVKSLAKQSIAVVNYESGRRDQVDVAVRRAIITGNNITTGKMQEQRIADLGVNLVYTSQHIGARPDHEVWQGMVFWYNVPVDGYKSFVETCKYGEGTGIKGYNCRHDFSAFYDGISEVSEQRYNTRESNEIYELEQGQRKMERMVRKWKRELAVLEAGGADTAQARAKVKSWQSRLKEYCKENNLRQIGARVRV